MARLLVLLRHAKSARDNPALADIDRPLNSRGERAAAHIGAFMAREFPAPGRVLCSPALRARQTWELVSARMPSPPEALICPELYAFGDGEPLLSCLRQTGGDSATVMIVSHNPSVQNLALRLVGTGGSAPRRKLAEKFPTAALAAIAFAADSWTDIAEGTGELQHFIRPGDLGDQD